MSEIAIRGCLEDPNPVQLGLIREIHEALTTPDGRLGDLSYPILSPEAQLDEKVNFHKHPAGAPLRDVNSPAVEKLREYIAGQRQR